MTSNHKYSPELLAQVAAESRSVNEVLRRLGLPVVGGSHTHISRRLKQLDIDTGHFTHFGKHHKRHTYTREELARAAAQSASIPEMLEHMGVNPYDSAYGYLRKRCADFGVDISHFRRQNASCVVFDDEMAVREAVATSVSQAGVLRRLRAPAHTEARRRLKAVIAELELDTSHFTGKVHNKGIPSPRRHAADEVLRHRPTATRRTPGHRLRRALAELGRAYVCSGCDLPGEWRGQPITLEVDHINGDWRDNRPQNLRLLCPNCHSQTDTYCRRLRQSDFDKDSAMR